MNQATYLPTRFDCVGCGQGLAAEADHHVLPGGRVLCGPCAGPAGRFRGWATEQSHARLFPECRNASRSHGAQAHEVFRGPRGAVVYWMRVGALTARTGRPPTLTGRANADGTVTIMCPYCRGRHRHGLAGRGAAHYASLCTPGCRKNDPGYVIVVS